MTNEEAIRELKDTVESMRVFDEIVSTFSRIDAITLAIKALEQKPCDDCISRQAVLDALDKSKYSNTFCEEHSIDWSINLGMAHIVVNELKPVTPQPEVDVLDKIRSEIEGYKSTIGNAISEDELTIEGMKVAYTNCLEIIDEYKAESEGKGADMRGEEE